MAEILVDYERQAGVPAQMVAEEPYLVVRVPTQGRSRTYLPFQAAPLKESAHGFSLSLVRPGNIPVEVQPGEPLDLVAVAVTANSLQTMLMKEHDVPGAVGRFLAGQSRGFGATYRTSARLRRIVANVQSVPDAVGMKGLYLQGKVYELLAEVFDAMGASSADGTALASDAHRALEAREILLANIVKPPSVADLAKQVGMSQRRLNAAFQDQFGGSPFQCLVRWRVDAAAEMLERQDISIKEVAFELGYRHVNNFTAAFARHKGVSPSQFRRKLRGVT